MPQKIGQIRWLKMPENEDGNVELQLRTFPEGQPPTHELSIYRLRRRHGAFNDNMGLLIAAALPGHLVTLRVTDDNEIVSVAIGEFCEET